MFDSLCFIIVVDDILYVIYWKCDQINSVLTSSVIKLIQWSNVIKCDQINSVLTIQS